MNQNLFEECFGEIIPSIDQLPLPIALVDDAFTIIWTTPYLRENYPYLTAPDSVAILLEGYDLKQLRLALKGSTRSRAYQCELPMLSTSLDFSPVFDKNGGFAGAIVHISVYDLDPSGISQDDANKMLTSFSTALRSPLASIFSAVSAMSGRLDLEDIDACECILSEINKNCYQLLKGFTSITEYSRYCNGLSILNLKTVPVNSFFKDLLVSARILLQSTGVHLTYELPEKPILLTMDADKVAIALLSLISNSAAFQDEDKDDGNEIKVTITAGEKYVTFNVSDHGVGIPEEIQPRIFEPYFSYGKDAFYFASTGLGLPLAKMIISHHGGTIAVHSEEEIGTTVAFTIPRNLDEPTDNLEDDDDLFDYGFSDNTASYIRNRFSLLYVYLSDVCECPEP